MAPDDLLKSNPSVSIAELRRSESRLRAIVDTAVDGIITIDDQGLIETFNPAAERMFGYRAAEVIGQNVGILMPVPDRQEHDGYLARYAGSGEPHILGIGREVQGQRKSGELFPLHLAVGENRVDGRRIYAGILRDLTADKEREAQLQETRDALMLQRLFAERLSALAEMSGGIAHELHQPLSGIRVYAETAKTLLGRHGERGAGVRAQQTLDKIIQQVDRAAIIIQHMREFAGEREADLPPATPVSVLAVLDSLVDLVGAQLQSHGIDIAVDIPPDLQVRCHQRRLEQVLLNLVTNARDGIQEADRPPDQRCIRVYAEANEGETVLRITDTGCGIAPELQAIVFDPFVSTKGPDRGTGLGLSICHGILRSYGAQIAVESSDATGSVIRLTFPPCNEAEESN